MRLERSDAAGSTRGAANTLLRLETEPALVTRAYFVTVSCTDVMWLRLPLTPAIVSVKVPLTPLPFFVFIFSVLAALAGFGTKVVLLRGGAPLTLKLTGPAKPFSGLTVTA